MSILTELGYDVRSPNAVQRAVQNLASSRPGAWVFSRTLAPIDRVVHRFSGGRFTVPGVVAALPVIMVTTTGARSGQPRTTPLLGIPLDGGLAVIGTNYGQRATPGWVYNLEANPAAEVSYRDAIVEARARPADAFETEAAFEQGSKFYAGYLKYRARADHRDIRVFVLETAMAP